MAEPLLGIGSPLEGCCSPSYILVITVISVANSHRRQQRRSVDKEADRGRGARTIHVVDNLRGAAGVTRKEVTIRQRNWRCSSRRATIITELFRSSRSGGSPLRRRTLPLSPFHASLPSRLPYYHGSSLSTSVVVYVSACGQSVRGTSVVGYVPQKLHKCVSILKGVAGGAESAPALATFSRYNLAIV